ncbi:DUF443 family protein [Virgibacillus sp. C22-A2]|uniref:DUF443 family protein n=1 Tax=Virgibacillus tibetensis TaxID=3042313 RepID=A0ABU6KJ94_9BACI|nr:DUF443 family protein [Virgibacillus sp. C22-A2]
MNCEVQHLEKNIRYRILIINGEQSILDMERSIWKIVFPFLFWLLPSPVFKVNDPAIVEKLKEPKKEKMGSSMALSLGGIAYAITILLAPLMDYFEIPSSPLVNTILLILTLLLVGLIYFLISHNRKRKLDGTVEIEELQQIILWLRPRSIKHIIKVSLVYLWFLVLTLVAFYAFIESRKIMLLIFGSIMLFPILLVSRVTVEQGHTTVKFKD